MDALFGLLQSDDGQCLFHDNMVLACEWFEGLPYVTMTGEPFFRMALSRCVESEFTTLTTRLRAINRNSLAALIEAAFSELASMADELDRASPPRSDSPARCVERIGQDELDNAAGRYMDACRKCRDALDGVPVWSRLVDRTDIAALFNVGVRTIDRWAKNGTIEIDPVLGTFKRRLRLDTLENLDVDLDAFTRIL